MSRASAQTLLSAKRLVIIGDSVTEGYGVSREQAFPALLQTLIENSGKKWRVTNSGIAGATSASAAQRVTWHLKQKPDLMMLALGANDGLRGTSTQAMEENLTKGIALAKRSGVKIILVGMRVPPNYGAKYSKDFADVFPRVAKKNDIPLVPFLLLNVAGEKTLNQSDGIHPNEKGHVIISQTIFKAIEKYL